MDFNIVGRDCFLDYGVRNNSDGSLLQRFFPIIDIVNTLGKAVGLPMVDTTINVSVH